MKKYTLRGGMVVDIETGKPAFVSVAPEDLDVEAMDPSDRELFLALGKPRMPDPVLEIAMRKMAEGHKRTIERIILEVLDEGEADDS